MDDNGRDNKGRFAEGGNHGRPKGSKDKTTTAAKELMVSALEGQAETMEAKLIELAKEDPVVYLNTLAKFLPYVLPKKVENTIRVDDEDVPIGSWIRFKETKDAD